MRRRRWLGVSRVGSSMMAALLITAALPRHADGQEIGRAALGAGLGVLGGVAITVATVVARAQLQNVYVHEPDDLIHWQSAGMIAAPAAGIAFGLRSRDALVGSFVGSVSGLALGAGAGAAVGWLLSEEPEGPWAGGAIGGGVGLAVGGLLGGILGWHGSRSAEGPVEVGLSVPWGGA